MLFIFELKYVFDVKVAKFLLKSIFKLLILALFRLICLEKKILFLRINLLSLILNLKLSKIPLIRSFKITLSFPLILDE